MPEGRSGRGGRRGPIRVPASLPASVLVTRSGVVFHLDSQCPSITGGRADYTSVAVVDAARQGRSLCQVCFPDPHIVRDFDALKLQLNQGVAAPIRLGRGDQGRLDAAGLDLDDIAPWHDLGFSLLQAIDLIVAGLPLKRAVAQLAEGATPSVVWHEHRQRGSQ